MTYYHAIRAACKLAFPHPALSQLNRKELTPGQAEELKRWQHNHGWHPNQLRHNAATMLRREFGLDTARVILGHSSPAVTEVYAETDRDKAIGIMGQIG